MGFGCFEAREDVLEKELKLCLVLIRLPTNQRSTEQVPWLTSCLTVEHGHQGLDVLSMVGCG